MKKEYYVNFEYGYDSVMANSEDEALEIFKEMIESNEIEPSIVVQENN